MASCMLGLLGHARAALPCVCGGSDKDHTQPLVDGSGEPTLNWGILGMDTGVVLCPAKLSSGQILLSGITGAGCIGRAIVVQSCGGCLV